MIRIPNSPEYAKNLERFRCKGTDQFCAVCGKPVPKPVHFIHEHDGGGWAVTEDEAATLDEGGNLGAQPVGKDCWKKHPELHPYEYK